MGCELTAGKSRRCRTGFGGIDSDLIVNKADIASYVVTGNALSSISLNSGKQGYLFEFEEETSNAVANGTGSRQNGTWVSQQSVTIANTDYVEATRDNEVELRQIETVHFVKYADGSILCYGLKNGLMLDSANHASGTAHEDKNGVDWVFSGKEQDAPFTVSTAIFEALQVAAS